MERFWRSEYRDVEAVLRDCGPEPRAAFVTALVEDVHAQRRRPGGARRRVLAAALSAGMIGAFAAFGGIGYAASAVKHAANVTQIAKMVGVSRGPTPASNGSETHNPTFGQYRPGKGCGDKNHIHLRENECKKPPK